MLELPKKDWYEVAATEGSCFGLNTGFGERQSRLGEKKAVQRLDLLLHFEMQV